MPMLIAGAAVFTQCSGPAKMTDPTRGKEVVFFDDFAGDGLDRTKWNVEVTGNTFNNEQQAYVDSVLTIYTASGEAAGGAKNALVIHPRYSPGWVTREGNKFDFLSGRITSKDKVEFTYGTVAARIKLSSGAGLWPAWWMLGSKANWPQGGEIDIMENIGEADWANAALHGPGYSGETPFVDRQYFKAGQDVTDWHIYAVEWTPESLVFTYDGKPMFRITKTMVAHYGKWVFDDPQFLLLNFALGGGFPFKINGVKQPYYGLPQETVDKIKANECKMLVDWVRITK